MEKLFIAHIYVYISEYVSSFSHDIVQKAPQLFILKTRGRALCIESKDIFPYISGSDAFIFHSTAEAKCLHKSMVILL